MLASDDRWRERWITARLAMERYHPDVAKLEVAVWGFCRAFVDQPHRPKRLLLYGNNGNGKSRALRAIKRWIADRALELPLFHDEENMRTCECALINWAEQVDRFKAGDWYIEHLIEADMLLLDDLGAEHDPSKAGVEKLYLLLERRERKWTVVTTNVLPEAWEQKFERRIADRLFRNFEHVDLSNLPSFSAR
jgi:DNA replication protein DnaC